MSVKIFEEKFTIFKEIINKQIDMSNESWLWIQEMMLSLKFDQKPIDFAFHRELSNMFNFSIETVNWFVGALMLAGFDTSIIMDTSAPVIEESKSDSDDDVEEQAIERDVLDNLDSLMRGTQQLQNKVEQIISGDLKRELQSMISNFAKMKETLEATLLLARKAGIET